MPSVTYVDQRVCSLALLQHRSESCSLEMPRFKLFEKLQVSTLSLISLNPNTGGCLDFTTSFAVSKLHYMAFARNTYIFRAVGVIFLGKM